MKALPPRASKENLNLQEDKSIRCERTLPVGLMNQTRNQRILVQRSMRSDGIVDALQQHISVIRVFLRPEGFGPIAVCSDTQLERISPEFIDSHLTAAVQDINVSRPEAGINRKASW